MECGLTKQEGKLEVGEAKASQPTLRLHLEQSTTYLPRLATMSSRKTNVSPRSPNAKSRQRQPKKRTVPAKKPPHRRGSDHGPMVSRATGHDSVCPADTVFATEVTPIEIMEWEI